MTYSAFRYGSLDLAYYEIDVPHYCGRLPFARFNHSEVINLDSDGFNIQDHLNANYFDCLNRMDEASYIFNKSIFEEIVTPNPYQLKNLPFHDDSGFRCKHKSDKTCTSIRSGYLLAFAAHIFPNGTHARYEILNSTYIA